MILRNNRERVYVCQLERRLDQPIYQNLKGRWQVLMISHKNKIPDPYNENLLLPHPDLNSQSVVNSACLSSDAPADHSEGEGGSDLTRQ